MSRIAAIIQLCLVFTLVCWVGSYPYMGRMMAHKKQSFLFQTVMGSGELVTRTYASDQSALERLERNRGRFRSLPVTEQVQLARAYDQLQEAESSSSFLGKLRESISLILFKLPPFDRAWIFFAIIVSVMLLLRSAGAPYAAWLLPFIVVAAAVDNQWHGVEGKLSAEAQIFPSEGYLVSHYVEGPLYENIFQQQDQLRDAWQLYLVVEWLHEVPASDTTSFAMQVEKAEHVFNLERLKRSLGDVRTPAFFQRKESITLWGIYFVWNLLFAWAAWRSRHRMIAEIKAAA